MNSEKIGYYAIIPANVRYDGELTANAKLLYGEITALCNQEGYCWATNAYFAQLYRKTKRSITEWIAQLQKQGYIDIEYIHIEGSKEVANRRIKICTTALEENFDGGRNLQYHIEENYRDNRKKSPYPLEENFQENITNNNTSNITLKYKKKYKTKDMDYSSVLAAIEDEELRNLYRRFIEMREFINAPMTDYALTLLKKKVEKLEPKSIERQKEILEAAILNRWKSVYPLKDEKTNSTQGNQSSNVFLDMLNEERDIL